MKTILRLIQQVLPTIWIALAGAALPASAAFNVTINSTGPQSGGSFSGRVWTPTAPSSVILVSNLLAQLEGGDVIINANGGGAEPGNITISSTVPLDDLVTTTGRTLTLNAHNDIAINAVITQSGAGGNNVPNAVSLVLNANSDSSGAGSVTQAANIQTGGGGLLVIGVGFTQNSSTTIDTQGGNIVVSTTGAVSLGGSSVSTGGGRIDIAAVSASTLSAAITTSGGVFNADVTGAGTLNINNDITTSGGDVDITTANGLLQTAAGADVNATGGAGASAVRLESLNGIANLVIAGSVSSGSGGARIAAGNNVTVSGTVSASGGPVTLAADTNFGGVGDLTLNSAISATGAGTISLTGQGFAQTATGTVTSAGGNITANFSLNAFTISRAISSTSGAISISGGAATLGAAISGGGGVSVIVSSITGNAGATVTAQNKAITLTGSSGAVDIIDAINSNGGNINVTAGTTLDLGSGLMSSGGGVITLSSAGAMTLFGPMTTAGGAFNADVTGAGTLSIQNDITTSGGTVDITTANGLLQTTAGSDVNASGGAGTAAVRLESFGGIADLVIASNMTSGTGGVRLAASNHVTVSGVVTAGGGPLTLAANTDLGALGNLTLNTAVSTTGTGTISLSGSGFAQTATGTVTSNSGNITASITNAFSISRAITSTSGVISITGGAATLGAAVSGGGGVSIIVPSITGNAGGTVTAQNEDIILTGSSGAVDIIDAINSNGGNINVTAGTTLALGSGLMSSGGGVITLSSSGAMTLFGPMTTSGGAFNADVTGAGTLSIQNDITTLGGTVDITTANGLLQTTAGSEVDASGGAGMAAIRLESLGGSADLVIASSITSGMGGVRLAAKNHVTVSGVVSGSGGSLTLAANTDLGALGDLTINTAVSTSGTGTISLSGSGFTQTATGTVTSSGGNITASFTNAFTISRAISSTSGAISVTGGAATLNAAISGGGGVSIIVPSITGNAGGTVTAQNSPITLRGSSGIVDIIDAIDSSGGNITVTAASTLELGTGLLSSGGGVITLTSVGSMTLFGPINTSGGAFNADVTGVGALSLQNDLVTSGGDVDMTTFNGLLQTTAGSDVNAFGGAGSAAVRLESLGGSADLTTLGAVYGGIGGTRLAAGNHLTVGGTLLAAGGLITLAADTNFGGGGNLAINTSVTAITSAQVNLSGVAFTQSGAGTVASAGGSITGTFRGAVNISKNISSTGGVITFTTPASLAVNAVLSTAPPAGGTGVLQATNSVVINATPVLGNANIVLISGSATAPVLAAASVSSITTTTAKLAGNVSSDGSMPVLERGFVYAPTLANANPVIGGPSVIKRTVSGTTGSFVADLTALTLGTSYSFKAYATNFIGTTYSSPVITFSTSVTSIGQRDETYQPTIIGSRIFATVVQADGKTLIGGSFSSVGGESHENIARLNADGSVDSSFQAGFDGQVFCIALRDDGKILVGGDFINANSKKHPRIAQLNSDGSLDSEGSFNPDASVDGEVISMILQPDGGILIGGRFSTVNDVGRNNIARLTADGFLDDKDPFNQTPGSNGAILSMAMQSDGRIIIGGEFTQVNSEPRNHIARLMADGSLDSNDTLNQGGGPNDSVAAVAVQADGKILIGGAFTTFNDKSCNHIARFDAEGKREDFEAFAAEANDAVLSMLLQTDGKILISGDFTSVNDISRGRIARLQPDGTLESSSTFGNGSGADASILSLAMQADGGILIAGDFNTFNGATQPLMARLLNDTATKSLIVVDATQVQWLRGGAGPEVTSVSFEVSQNDGASWKAVGVGSRITGGWELTGLSLPSSGLLRARGHSAGGHANGSSGLMEQQTTLVLPQILVLGNGNFIAPGDNSPIAADGTHFGSVIALGVGAVQHTFTVQNNGKATLNLTGTPSVRILGADARDFRVSAQPQSFVEVDGSTTFSIRFNPTLPGLRSATVAIANDDAASHPYTFTISGTGLPASSEKQSITFTPPANVFQNEGPLALSAIASSGLPVSFRLLGGPATLTGSTLTFTGLGAMKVEATQTGSSLYLAATPVTRTITVKPAPKTPTLIGLNQVYNGTPRSVGVLGNTNTPIITYTINGVPSLVAPTRAGNYAVNVEVDGKNLTGKLVIAKAPLFVTPSSHRRFIGQANPTFTVSYSGFVSGDFENLVFSAAGARRPAMTTTAKSSSPAGTYAITAKDLLLVDYTPIYLTGSLIVESFAGSYETLLTDATSGLPAGKVEFTIGASSTGLTGKLTLPSELAPLPFTGTLNLGITSEAEFATGSTIPIIKGVNSYVLELTLPFGEDFTTHLFANASPTANASSNEGRSLFIPVKDQKILFAGAHTLILGSALPASSTTPLGSGHATATIDAKAMLKITGRLADGTSFTTTLAPDAAAGYRLFAQPYNRSGSYLAGWLDFEIHPTLAPRVYLPAGATDLVWRKSPGPTDKAYRSGFGPVATSVSIDPWLTPSKTTTLTTLLELPTSGDFGVEHTGLTSASSASLPTDLKLDSTGKIAITAPTTLPSNATKWSAKLDANTGAITGSFTLTDQVPAPTLSNLAAKKNVSRLVPFTGTLRQPHGTGTIGAIGAGFLQIPALPTDSTNEVLSGGILFTL
jgi:uncharacterized delta-60 repeat protein